MAYVSVEIPLPDRGIFADISLRLRLRALLKKLIPTTIDILYFNILKWYSRQAVRTASTPTVLLLINEPA